MNILLYSAIFLPMAAAVLCYIVGRNHKKLRDNLASAVTCITFILCLCLAAQTITTPNVS